MRHIQIRHRLPRLPIHLHTQPLLNHPLHLLQLLRQRIIIRQPPARIHNHRIIPLLHRHVQRPVQYRRGRRTRPARITFHRGRKTRHIPRTFRPHLQLLHRRGAKRVARREHDFLIPLGPETMSEFANGGSFSHSVRAHDEIHRGKGRVGRGEVEAAVTGVFQVFDEFPAEDTAEVVAAEEGSAVVFQAPDFVHHVLGGL
mmetsp:Transcript_13946/g.17552  ORF Transcript_13946/g.17552 Transcript_13946/m.17552 type:complete len:200 (+) Transcript_13946:700-1299(+)